MVTDNRYTGKSRDSVFLDGIALSSFGLVAEMPQPVPMAKQRYTTWQSGDSDHTVPDDSFEDVEYTLTVRKFRDPQNFLTPEFNALAASAKTLIISRHTGRFYKIRKLLGITPAANVKGNEVVYRISFALAPFAYHAGGNTQVQIENYMIENPGTRYSKPVYKFTHPQNTSTFLSVNGQILTVTYEAASPIIIDTERMIALSESGVNQTQYTQGYFPLLSTGTNNLSAYYGTQGGTAFCPLYVTPNWRDY